MHPSPFQPDLPGVQPEDEGTYLSKAIQNVLFTNPGEDVDRSSFGCGLQLRLFGPVTPELLSSAEILARQALGQWLGAMIQLRQLAVQLEDDCIRIHVDYSSRRTQQIYHVTFAQSLGP